MAQGMRLRQHGEWTCLGLLVVGGAVLAATVLAFSLAIRDSTAAGECIGMTDWPDRDTTLTYRVSTRNVIVGLVGIETVVVPAYIILERAMCPESGTTGGTP